VVERGEPVAGGGAAGQGRDDGQALLPRAEVRADGLAGDGGVAPDAQQVVDELEGEPEAPSELPQGVDPFGLGTRRECAQRAGRGEQGRRLAGRRLQAFVQADVRPGLEDEIGALAGDQCEQGPGELPDGLGASRGEPVGEGVDGDGQEGVTRQDRLCGAEQRPRRIRPRRSRSPSMRSSCTAEKLWTSSTAAAGATASSAAAPSAWAAASTRAARTPFPPSPFAGRPHSSDQPK